LIQSGDRWRVRYHLFVRFWVLSGGLQGDGSDDIQAANDLLMARIEDRHMHFLGKRGMSLGGMLLGIYLKLNPIGPFHFDVGTFLLATLGGLGFGAWCSTLIGLSAPNSKLRPFEADIEAGRILLMVDVPVSRVEEIEALLTQRHPGAVDRGIEPSMPAFP
jgi:hypothetical protein